MKKFALGGVDLFVMIVIFSTVVRAEEGLKEGKWEVTMVTKMEGLPPMDNIPPEVAAAMNKMGTQNTQTLNGDATLSTQWNPQGITSTVTQCVTNENAYLSYPNDQTSDCKRTQQRDGNTFKFHSTCNQHGEQTDVTGYFTYMGDTMNGLVTIHSKDLNSVTQYSGKYIGPC